MPEKKTLVAAEKDKEEGKAPSTQAGELVREEIHHIREGKHGARNAKQAIAIGLSKARRAGVKLPPPKKGRTSDSTRRKAAQDTRKGKEAPQTSEKAPAKRSSGTRRGGTTGALKKEGRQAASKQALSRQGRDAASHRTKEERSRAARKGAATRNANRKKREEEKAPTPDQTPAS